MTQRECISNLHTHTHVRTQSHPNVTNAVGMWNLAGLHRVTVVFWQVHFPFSYKYTQRDEHSRTYAHDENEQKKRRTTHKQIDMRF